MVFILKPFDLMFFLISKNSMINQDLLIGAGIGFTILTIIFTLYFTVFRHIMPDHKEDDGKPYFPFD